MELLPLKLERMKRKISQWELAKKFGMSQTEISMYETGKRRVPLSMRGRYASLLGANIDILFPEGY